jgi:hypothetical protein
MVQMIDETVTGRLRAYIKERYILHDVYLLSAEKESRMTGASFELVKYHLETLSFSKLANTVEQFIAEKKKEETFAVLLKRKMREKGMTSKETYEGAGIDRKLFSKINTNDGYHPNKNTVIALGLSLKLAEPEMRELLESAGYVLAQSSIADLVILFCVENGIFNVIDVNALLFETGETTLGRNMA